MPKKTAAAKAAETLLQKNIARTFGHEQTLLLLHALEMYAITLDLMDARFPSAEARMEAAAARMLRENVSVAHSIRRWLDADEEDRSSTQPSENDRSSTSPDRSSTQLSENDRSPTGTTITRSREAGPWRTRTKPRS